MGVLIKLSDLSEKIGDNTADFIDKLADETRKFACNLWELYPDQITNNSNLGSSFARGFMNNMCQDQVPPPPPAPPLTGGQCAVLYNVFIKAFQSNLTTCAAFDFTNQRTNILGPISGLNPVLVEIINPGEQGSNVYAERFEVFIVHNNGQQTSGGFFVISECQNNDDRYFIDSVVRADGLPDNCGDPPTEYPPTEPPPGAYNTIININTEDGGTLNYSLSYNPVNYNFPMAFNLGGLDIEINLGGIEFNYNPRDNSDNPEPLPDGQDDPIPTPPDDKNRDFNYRKIPPPNTTDYEETTKTEQDPKEEDVGDRLEFVRVVVTLKPTNVKNQWGDGAPSVYYCGWFEFQADGYNFRREPIHWEQAIFKAPEGATGYAYTLYEGFKGFAQVYTRK